MILSVCGTIKVLRIIPFLNTEKFVVIEVGDHYRKATSLGLDSEKNLFVRKIYEDKSGEYSLGQFLKSVKIPKRSNILVGLSAKRVITIPASVVILRDNPKEDMREEELANLVSQAVWRSLNRFRAHASDRLKVGDLEVVLGSLRILNIRVDGHKVINPIGFRAKRIEFDIEQTFVPRSLVQEFKEALPAHAESPFYVELGSSLSKLLLRTAEEDQFVFANLGSSESSLYRINKNARYMGSVSLPYVDHIGEVGWGDGEIGGRCADYFNIERSIARQVMHSYLEGGVSENANRTLHRMFCDSVSLFIHNTRPKLKVREVVYWNSYEYELPTYLAKKEGVHLKKVDCMAMVEKLGIKVHAPRLVGSGWRSVIPIFLDYYYLKEENWLNTLANQRASWLIP